MVEKLQGALCAIRVLCPGISSWCSDYNVDPASETDLIQEFLGQTPESALENLCREMEEEELEEEIIPMFAKMLDDEDTVTKLPTFITALLKAETTAERTHTATEIFGDLTTDMKPITEALPQLRMHGWTITGEAITRATLIFVSELEQVLAGEPEFMLPVVDCETRAAHRAVMSKVQSTNKGNKHSHRNFDSEKTQNLILKAVVLL